MSVSTTQQPLLLSILPDSRLPAVGQCPGSWKPEGGVGGKGGGGKMEECNLPAKPGLPGALDSVFHPALSAGACSSWSPWPPPHLPPLQSRYDVSSGGSTPPHPPCFKTVRTWQKLVIGQRAEVSGVTSRRLMDMSVTHAAVFSPCGPEPPGSRVALKW